MKIIVPLFSALALFLASPIYAGESIDKALAAQDEELQARYQFRHPKETIKFFEIEPGETVLEALPGGGWYSKILLAYLGTEGKLIGVDYDHSMWQHFGFADSDFIEERADWPADWKEKAAAWGVEGAATIEAATLGTISEDIHGTVDTALYIRALHNLARFDDKGDYLNNALQATFLALKPGGILGVVQHRAREDRNDEWANGSNGYLKQSRVIAAAEKAGFELVASSDVNANEKDQATDGDKVWRLPPSLAGSDENPEQKAAMQAIGESHRMTLKFRKPAADEG